MAASLITRAADYAARCHVNQKRKDGVTPYIVHPLRVAAILTEEGDVDDPQVVAAAMLHDVVEDTEATFDDLEAHFSHTTVHYVRQVTDDKNLAKEERKRLQIEHTSAKGEHAMWSGSKLIKLADKLANLRDLQTAPPPDYTDERILEYFAWAKRVTDNCAGLNWNLDRALKVVYTQGPFYFRNKPDGVSTRALPCPRCAKPMPEFRTARYCDDCMFAVGPPDYAARSDEIDLD